ncbi:MAG TPA: DNA-binding response regulator, partial [Ornithinibacter sp.]|nr:DNA-binding response regulator [Ornithinibacter sp.]
MTRILIVEDEVSFSDPLSYLLSKEGYEVSVAE